MKTTWTGYKAAKAKVRFHMAEARDCVRLARNTGDPFYWQAARIHVQTARHYNRNAWRGQSNGA